MKPRLAVVLAAGRGVRLGERGRETPKGLLEVGGRSLIERSLDALRGAGIERVVLVTGHLADRYAELARRLGDQITLVHNPDFAASGSFVSLQRAGAIEEPYLLVESDLLFEARAPRLVVDAELDSVLLASGPTGSGDEVHVGVEHGRLVDLTKRRERLRGDWGGELVGITRVSPALHAEMLRRGAELLRGTPHVEYESALVAAAGREPVHVLRVDDLVWTEVDDVAQLDRATAVIAPRLGIGVPEDREGPTAA